MNPMVRNPVILVLVVASALALPGCGTVRHIWPFGKAPVIAPQPVQELEVRAPSGQSAPPVQQFWERNTLLIDLQGVPSTGQIQLLRKAGGEWPVRLALRMLPGKFEAIELRGSQRVVMPVAQGTQAITIEVPAGVYPAAAQQLTVTWGSKSSF
jgi:hypothetical protein